MRTAAHWPLKKGNENVTTYASWISSEQIQWHQRLCAAVGGEPRLSLDGELATVTVVDQQATIETLLAAGFRCSPLRTNEVVVHGPQSRTTAIDETIDWQEYDEDQLG